MADKKTAKPGAPSNNPSPEKQIPNKVTQLHADKCAAQECKKGPEKANFCKEHFVWFKEGLITIGGDRSKDFDKKYHAWLRRTSKAA